jgi:hypothetical protein
MGLEGLVLKHRDSFYRAGRFDRWIKVKNRQHPAFSGDGCVRLSHDLDQGCPSVGTKNTSMAVDPRRISFLEVAGVVTIILSAVLLAGIVYSIW